MTHRWRHAGAYQITFDCYGTLIDWERGITDVFARALAATRSATSLGGALAAYHEIEPVVEAESYRSYREILTEVERRVAHRLGWAVPEALAGFIAESLPR